MIFICPLCRSTASFHSHGTSIAIAIMQGLCKDFFVILCSCHCTERNFSYTSVSHLPRGNVTWCLSCAKSGFVGGIAIKSAITEVLKPSGSPKGASLLVYSKLHATWRRCCAKSGFLGGIIMQMHATQIAPAHYNSSYTHTHINHA